MANVFYSTFLNVFLFLPRFFTFFNVFYFSWNVFLHLCYGPRWTYTEKAYGC